MTIATAAKPVGIGIIGMGFMGQTHARAYLGAIEAGSNARLVGVCDRDADRRSGIASDVGNIKSGDAPERIFDEGTVTGYDDAGALLGDDGVDLVSICTPTDSHVDLAIRALEAGKHVLVEKPVGTRLADIERLIEAAEKTDRLCVPAMCMRHWPGWSELKQIVDSGRHGRVRHARFDRLGSMPAWGAEFYNDLDRSGGAIFDLHVHDADMVLWLFGAPESVSSAGDHRHVSSQYRFRDGPAVGTTGGWLSDRSFPFSMRFLIEFERAVLTFDAGADEPLTLHAEGNATRPKVESGTGYDHQARAVIAAARGGTHQLPGLRDAFSVTRLILAEQQSADEQRPVPLDW
jgi:predicted dehydrogenase